MMKKIKVISIITTICIMALIFFFSSQNREESASLSRGLVGKIVAVIVKLVGGIEEEKKEIVHLLHNFIRSAAHFIIFAFLGVSSVIMFLLNLNRTEKTVFFTALAFCFVYACSDEIHQIFVEGRAFQFTDIIIDTLGSACGIAIIAFLKRIYLRFKRKGADAL